MKISIKHNNNRDSFVCLPSPNIPPPRNFAIHPVCHIEYILFRCKISSLSFLEFALCTSCLFHTKREILLCQEVLRCNDKLFLLWRSSHNTEKCTPGSYLLQWPRYSNSMTTSLPPLLGPHIPLFPPTSHPAQCGLVSAPSTQMSCQHCLRPRACPLAGGIRSCHS